jgi:hypothetical protein
MKSEARLLIAVVDDDKSAGKALGRLLRAVRNSDPETNVSA